MVEDLFAQDYLQQAFGYNCVDQGVVPGALGRDPDLYFIRRLGYSIMPIDARLPAMEPDEAFDTIEVLYDLVSEGIKEPGSYTPFPSVVGITRDSTRQQVKRTCEKL